MIQKDVGKNEEGFYVHKEDFARPEKISTRPEEEFCPSINDEDADKSEADAERKFQKEYLRFGWEFGAITTVSTK